MSSTYNNIEKQLKSELAQYQKLLITPWIFLILTLLAFYTFGFTLQNSPNAKTTINLEIVSIFVLGFFAYYFWKQKNCKLKLIVRPINLDKRIRKEAIPELISEIDKSTEWTKSVFQVFLAVLTIIFFAINAFVTFISFLYDANVSILDKYPKELMKIANQVTSELLQMTTVSFYISLISVIILFVMLIIVVYNTFLSKRKFVQLCLYETYYTTSNE